MWKVNRPRIFHSYVVKLFLMQVSAARSEQGTGEKQVQGMMAQAYDMVFSTVHHICIGSIVTRLHSGQFRVQFFSAQNVQLGSGGCFPGVRQPGCEADCASLYSATVNKWNYTCTPCHICLYVMDKDSSTFTPYCAGLACQCFKVWQCTPHCSGDSYQVYVSNCVWSRNLNNKVV